MTLKELASQVRQDLLPTAGRARDACRVTLGALLVCIFMFATSMPFVDLGVYLVFLLAQRDTLATRKLAGGSLLVAALATLLIMGVMMFAWDITWLRLLLWTVIFFFGYFMMRVFIEPDLFLGPLVIVALCTFIADQVPLPNLLLDQLGWLWAFLPVVAFSVFLSEWLVGAATPREMLIIQMERIFQLVEDGMRERVSGRTPIPLDPDEIDDLVKRASLMSWVRLLTPAQASRCAELARLVAKLEGSASRAGAESRPADFWEQTSDCVATVRKRLRNGPATPLPEAWPASAHTDDLSQRITHFRAAAEALQTGADPGADGALESMELLLPDWRTNPAYIAFALRATAATMATYLFMSLTHWNGIHTCMITCVVTAISAVDAQVRKQNLRMIGAVIGGVAGVGALVFILPAHQNFAMLLMLIGFTSFGAAWVAVGPLRIGYAGLQMALAVYYVLLAEAHLSTEIAPIRDRLIGIFIGILAMRAAFVWCAPRPAEFFSSSRSVG